MGLIHKPGDVFRYLEVALRAALAKSLDECIEEIVKAISGGKYISETDIEEFRDIWKYAFTPPFLERETRTFFDSWALKNLSPEELNVILWLLALFPNIPEAVDRAEMVVKAALYDWYIHVEKDTQDILQGGLTVEKKSHLIAQTILARMYLINPTSIVDAPKYGVDSYKIGLLGVIFKLGRILPIFDHALSAAMADTLHECIRAIEQSSGRAIPDKDIGEFHGILMRSAIEHWEAATNTFIDHCFGGKGLHLSLQIRKGLIWLVALHANEPEALDRLKTITKVALLELYDNARDYVLSILHDGLERNIGESTMAANMKTRIFSTRPTSPLNAPPTRE